jgi:hypothetical protein
MPAIKQLESAMNRFNRDVDLPRTVVTAEENGFPLELSWMEWDNTVRSVTYSTGENEWERAYYMLEIGDKTL